MSRAFVKEDSQPADDPAATRRVALGHTAYITPAGFRALQKELDELWHVKRPQITAEVATAAAQGDRSENAEYIYGKKKLREIDRRIEWISKRLDQLVVCSEPPTSRDRVFFGAWVTVEDEDGQEATYRIVGADETDIKSGAISIESPVARALMGRRVGDTVTVTRPKGQIEITVAAIRYQD